MSMLSTARAIRKIGASVEFPDDQFHRRGAFMVDVRRVGGEEKFILNLSKDAQVEVLEVDPPDRHLLIMIKDMSSGEPVKHRFILGHDEKHLFAAPIPGTSITNIRQAKEALKPAQVKAVQGGVRGKKLNAHRNQAFVRQGEWFFIPQPGFNPPKDLILKNEPISRGQRGSKPHMVEKVYRSGGQDVMVAPGYDAGITVKEYRALLANNPSLSKLHWQPRRRNAVVYAMGKVRHPDHSTVLLPIWHMVVMNTEHLSTAGSHLAFID